MINLDKKLTNDTNASDNVKCFADDLGKVNTVLPVLKETPKEKMEKEDNSSDDKIKLEERPREELNQMDENVNNLDKNQDLDLKTKELNKEKENSQKDDKKTKKKSNCQYIDSEMKSSPQITTLNKLNEFKDDKNRIKPISQENIFNYENDPLNADNIDSEYFSPLLRQPEKKLFISSPKKTNDENVDKNEHLGDIKQEKIEEKETSEYKEKINLNNEVIFKLYRRTYMKI
jgi:hypothetical protein